MAEYLEGAKKKFKDVWAEATSNDAVVRSELDSLDDPQVYEGISFISFLLAFIKPIHLVFSQNVLRFLSMEQN